MVECVKDELCDSREEAKKERGENKWYAVPRAMSLEIICTSHLHASNPVSHTHLTQVRTARCRQVSATSSPCISKV
jgi:hypothetical protein